MIEYLQKEVCDLDCVHNCQQSADRQAFACLIKTKLNPAVLYSTWCEWHSAKHLRVRLSERSLPTPVPFAQRLIEIEIEIASRGF